MSTNQPEHETQTVLELPLDTAQLSEQTSDVKEGDRSLDALKAMSQVLPDDTGFHLITLILMQQTHSLKAEQLHYFRGPIIFGKTPWSDALPQDAIQKLMNAVRLERYWLILEELKSAGSKQPCTASEIVCALQPYTLVGPLDYRYTELYTWAFQQMLQLHPGIFGEGGTHLLDEMQGTLGQRQPDSYVYFELGSTIRRRVIAHARQHFGRVSAKVKPESKQPPLETSSQPMAIQFDLFGEL